MSDRNASRTALGTAYLRAAHQLLDAAPRILEDPLAVRLLGPAAAMDIGGRKMAGFASGVIDSFQYFGASIALKALGWLLDLSWHYYFYYMAPFGLLGGFLMWTIAGRKSLKKGG